MTADPSLSIVPGPNALCVAAGSWTATHATQLERAIDNVAPLLEVKHLTIDMHGVGALDTYGAWLLERFMRARKAQGAETDVASLPERYHNVFTAMQKANCTKAPTAAHRHAALDAVESVGKATAEVGADLLAIATMLGAVGTAFAAALAKPRTFRVTSAVNQLERVGLQAVPIIVLISFLVGGIIAQQGSFSLRVRRRALRRRLVRHPDPARDRRAYHFDHGRGPLRQLLHCRARLHEDARGDRRPAYDGARSY